MHRSVLAALAASALAGAAAAQPFPAKPIRFIVPFAPAEAAGTPPEEFGRFLVPGHARWSEAVKAANVTVQ